MLITMTKAAKLSGFSRRTFYNHIKTKGISTTLDDNGEKKIDMSELERVYGKEKILANRKALEDSQGDNGNTVQIAQGYTPSPKQQQNVAIELVQQQLKSSETLIEQLKGERDRLIGDKEKMQSQLDKALEIASPVGKLLEDQRDTTKLHVEHAQNITAEKTKRMTALEELEREKKNAQDLAKRVGELEKSLKQSVAKELEAQRLHKKARIDLEVEKTKPILKRLFK